MNGWRAAALACAALVIGPALPRASDNPFTKPGTPAPRNAIDAAVFTRLTRLGIQPAPLCSDAVFLRRVYLDTIGTLPDAGEVRAFVADTHPDKRSALVDRLLAHDEFADYWAMKWSDLLRVKSEFPINLWPNAVQAYHRWVRTSVRDNLPYDRFVHELLTQSGSNFRVPQVNFYRAIQSREPQAIASAVALTFMGARTETWPPARLAGMAVFFSRIHYKPTAEWKEEIVFFDPADPAGGTRHEDGTFPDGTTVQLPSDVDPREVFAKWLIAPRNPWFARALVNRVWSWFFGRGIIQEPDDIRADNPPINPELLAVLERELVTSRYDLRHLYRLILNSTTYQLSSIPASDAAAAGANFAHYAVRPLEAEVLIDALNQMTGTTDQYSSLIPEPYTFIPEDQRAIALGDGSITSSFLDTFGRPSRDTGLLSERNTRPTAAQRLHLLNSSHVQRKLEQSRTLQAVIQARAGVRQMVTDLYLTMLSRYPTADEVATAIAYVQKAGGNRRIAGLDLAWALINSEEFLYRH